MGKPDWGAYKEVSIVLGLRVTGWGTPCVVAAKCLTRATEGSGQSLWLTVLGNTVRHAGRHGSRSRRWLPTAAGVGKQNLKPGLPFSFLFSSSPQNGTS